MFMALCRIALNDISSDEEEVSGVWDGDGDNDEGFVLEVLVGKEDGQEELVASSQTKALLDSQQHGASSGVQQPVTGP